MTKRARSPSLAFLAKAALACAGALAMASPSWATPVDRADWTAASAGTASGTVQAGSASVGVTYGGVGYSFAQVNNNGTNYFLPSVRRQRRAARRHRAAGDLHRHLLHGHQPAPASPDRPAAPRRA